MWKETFLFGIIAAFRHERRKRELLVPHNRRMDNGKLTSQKSRDIMQESLDKFSQTIIMNLPKEKK